MKIQRCKKCGNVLNSKLLGGGLFSDVDILYYCYNPKCKLYKLLRLEEF